MMRQTLPLALAIAVAAASAAWAQPKPKPKPKKDRVILNNGTEHEGDVKTDTYKEVIIDVGGRTERAAADDVFEVIYHDAPDAFLGAIGRIKENAYGDGLSSLNSAEEWVTEQVKKDKNFKIRAWFKPYFLYWRSVCFARMGGKEDQAIRGLQEYMKESAAASRFIKPAISVAFEVFRKSSTPDVKGAEAFMSSAPVPAEIQPAVKLELGELLLSAGEPDKAVPLFSAVEADATYGIRALVGGIKCLIAKKDWGALEGKAKAIIAGPQDNRAHFVGKLALGEIRFDTKQYLAAIDVLSDAVVKNYAPGMDGERERALFVLARAYVEYALTLKNVDAKIRFFGMGERAYNELALLYPSGKYKGEAESKSEELEKLGAELEKSKPPQK
jgi:predicted negative regulator of RcsB-dependent stress response